MRKLYKLLPFMIGCLLLFAFLPRSAAHALEPISWLDADGNLTQTSAYYASLTTGATALSGNVAVSGTLKITDTRLRVEGEATLILLDGAELTLPKGIQVNESSTLTITAQSGGSAAGRLTIDGVDDFFAGIGHGINGAGGTIIINGGAVTVTGGIEGAGIGGGYKGRGGTVTINGGAVTVTGGSGSSTGRRGGAGIGGGYKGDGGTVTINGGAVTATGSDGGAGIGGGWDGAGGNITISGGKVTATGSNNGAGIGGGAGGAGGTLDLSLSGESDCIRADSYFSSLYYTAVTVAEGCFLMDESGNVYFGKLSEAQLNAMHLQTLTKAAAYDVLYDFNGGSGRVKAQTKLPGENVLTLTDAIPTREGWTFVGWAESADAAAASYLPGGSYTKDSKTTLYAVWKQPDFVLPASLTQIGEEAFQGGAFSFVKLPENAVAIGPRAFENCAKLAYIYIPAEAGIGENAFNGVTGLTIIGWENSPAEQYAQQHGIGFVPAV